MMTDYLGKFTVYNEHGCVKIDFIADPNELTDQDWDALFNLSRCYIGALDD